MKKTVIQKGKVLEYVKIKNNEPRAYWKYSYEKFSKEGLKNRDSCLFSGIFRYKVKEFMIKKFKKVNSLKKPVQLTLELGKDLFPLVDALKGAYLLERITEMRKNISNDLGLEIPKIRIIDNMNLSSSEYCIKIYGIEKGKSIIKLGHCLCINPDTVKKKNIGEKTNEPAFGLPALWISEDNWDKAIKSGYTVADHPGIIITHLSKIIRYNIYELLNRQNTQTIIDNLKKHHQIVVDEVLLSKNGKNLTLGQIKVILQGLLKEQVSIKNMVTIMETIADSLYFSIDSRFHIERVRQALANQLCHQYADKNQTLHVLTLDKSLELKIIDSKYSDSFGNILSVMESPLYKAWIKALKNSVSVVKDKGYTPLILCSSQARYLARNALYREFPDIAVLSVPEIAENYNVKSIGVITLEQEQNN